jgi:diketogulonate reductase-like aldo/keto reductase
MKNAKYPIPQLGFGVYQSPPEVCKKSCLTALKAGYRHIDTAQYYANEVQVGEAIKESGIPRSEIYVTSKILSAGKDVEASYKSIAESVKKIGGGYADLFLIHSPNAGKDARENMWRALEKAKKEGKVRAIGVSNYGQEHIEEMKEYADNWPPAVNQIELHPWLQQKEAVQYCEKEGIVLEAYCPLVRNQKADDKTLNAIADKYKVTTAQVLIRWSLQRGFVSLPKSDTPSRIEANAGLYGFELSKEDMKALDDLDRGAAGSIVMAVKGVS